MELTQEQLDALEAERVAEEARKESLKARFEALTDSGMIQATSHIGNPAAYFRDEILPASPEDAEARLSAIEVAYHAGIPMSQEQINAEALAYLASTDWLVIRAAEGGPEVPEEIKQARAEARAKVI